MFVVLALVLCLVSATVSGCAQEAAKPATPPKPVAPEVELKVAVSDDISNIDPAAAGIIADRTVGQQIFEGLVTFDLKTYGIVPSLAEKWEVSPDGKTYTFYLRKGVMFQKGFGELTSADVKFSLERHLDPQVASRESVTFSNMDKVETPDKYTAKILLKNPEPGFMSALAWQSGFIVSEKAVKQFGKDFGLNPVGTGAYMFDSWVQKEKVVLKANDQYWGGKPQVTKVTIRIIPDETIAVQAVSSGEIDLVGVTQVSGFRAAKDVTNVDRLTAKSATINHIWLQTAKAPTNDIRVRKAIAYALDIPAMVKSIGDPIVDSPAILNPLCVGYTTEFTKYEHNLDKAKALIKEAKLPANAKLIIYYRRAQLFEPITLIVKEQLSKILPCELVQLEAGIQAAKFREGEFNVGIWSVARLEADQMLLPYYLSTGANNYAKWKNAEVDKLLNAGRVELDPKKRAANYEKVQQIIADELPVISAGLSMSLIVARKGITGIQPHPFAGLIEYRKLTLPTK